MAYELIAARLPYRQAFLRPRRRTTDYGWFRRDEQLRIDVVDPDAATVAYEVWLGPETSPRTSGYQILSYDDCLWWPLGGDYGRACHFENYADMLGRGATEALVSLHPAFAQCTSHSPPDPIPAELTLVDNDPYNNLADCLAFAHQGANETIIFGNGVFVEAGEPIFYAVPDERDPKSLALQIGVSHTSRECGGTNLSEPGVALLDRKSSARRGHAFGIDELDEGLFALSERGYRLHHRSRVDVLIKQHRAETAPLLCARELAEFLFDESFGLNRKAEGLRANVPVIHAADDAQEVGGLSVATLEQLRSSCDAIVAYEFLRERRDAAAILKRLDSLGHGATLDPVDDTAIATLGPG